MRKCKNCGNEFEGMFCSNCGTQAVEENTCNSCGKSVQSGLKFCPHCGSNLSAPVQPAINETIVTKSNFRKKMLKRGLIAAGVSMALGAIFLIAILIFVGSKLTDENTAILFDKMDQKMAEIGVEGYEDYESPEGLYEEESESKPSSNSSNSNKETKEKKPVYTQEVDYAADMKNLGYVTSDEWVTYLLDASNAYKFFANDTSRAEEVFGLADIMVYGYPVDVYTDEYGSIIIELGVEGTTNVVSCNLWDDYAVDQLDTMSTVYVVGAPLWFDGELTIAGAYLLTNADLDIYLSSLYE